MVVERAACTWTSLASAGPPLRGGNEHRLTVERIFNPPRRDLKGLFEKLAGIRRRGGNPAFSALCLLGLFGRGRVWNVARCPRRDAPINRAVLEGSAEVLRNFERAAVVGGRDRKF